MSFKIAKTLQKESKKNKTKIQQTLKSKAKDYMSTSKIEKKKYLKKTQNSGKQIYIYKISKSK